MAEFNQFKLGDAIQQGQGLAMNDYRLSEARRSQQARQGLTGALQAGTPEAMESYSKQFPDEAMEYKNKSVDSRKRELENSLFQFSVIEKLMSGVVDEPSFQKAKEMMAYSGMDVSRIPQSFDPNYIMQQRNQALGVKGQMEMELRKLDKKFEVEKFNETKRHNLATEAISADRNKREVSGKPPAGYRWSQNGNLEPIPGGPATKPTEAQQKQLNGVTNLQNAVDEYLNQLKNWKTGDVINPNSRAKMGTKYNNMMLQAKEAYNLGVLNGPDFDILQRVITDPRSLTGVITSNEALAEQAKELKRIMSTIGGVAATGQVRDMSVTTPDYNSRPAPESKTIQNINDKGWKLMRDANGNRAYVGPNGEIEEIR